MPLVRIRLAVALLSFAAIGLQLGLMRLLALRFWHHFAAMVIGVALLGFGASGTALALCGRRVRERLEHSFAAACLGCGVAVPLAVWGAGHWPVNVQALAWDAGEVLPALLLELFLLVPFALAGAGVGLALMDAPARISGHYAANLLGSGVGAFGTVGLLQALSPTQALLALGAAAWCAGALALPWPRKGAFAVAFLSVAAFVGLAMQVPAEPAISQYKALAQVRAMPGSEQLVQREGPLGRLDVMAGPAIHHAPGLSLQYTEDLPPHVLLLADGEIAGPVYDCAHRADWAFLDATTPAAAYRVAPADRALVVGAGGGKDLGLARFHGCETVVALEMNPQVIALMRGALAGRGGRIYSAGGVRVENAEARGFLTGQRQRFDVIQLPSVDAFGASGAGLYAAQESYLYTAEAFQAMLACLAPDGVLAITRWARVPPRDGLRVLDTAAAALRAQGRDPRSRLAMLRSWATVTVLASPRPFGAEKAERLRVFCCERGFDLCYLPGLRADEANRFHVLPDADYFRGARALLGPERDDFLQAYLFAVDATTDDRPFFHHFFRWKALSVLRERLGGRSRAFLELGYLLLLAALVQAVVLAALLIVLPLAPGIRRLRAASGKAASFAVFLALGIGFMLLEVGFLQKLILYLAHPVYAAAVAIASFLVFSGAGSYATRRLDAGRPQIPTVLALLAAGLGLAYCGLLDPWLALTRGHSLSVRIVVAAVTLGPLAFVLGTLFPLLLRRVAAAEPRLVPWAWAVNGFGSVTAATAAPVLAMAMGFSRVLLVAVVCYGLVAFFGRRLPG